jgi:hypothetical protein
MAVAMNHQPEQLTFEFISPVGGDVFEYNSGMMTMQRLIDGFQTWGPTIQKALDYGGHTHTPDDVFKMAIQGRIHCYFFDGCFVFMEVVDYPQSRVYHCFISGGEMEAMLSHEDDLAKLALAMNCTHLSFAGRHGWKRVFEQRGWDFICITMHKDLRT